MITQCFTCYHLSCQLRYLKNCRLSTMQKFRNLSLSSKDQGILICFCLGFRICRAQVSEGILQNHANFNPARSVWLNAKEVGCFKIFYMLFYRFLKSRNRYVFVTVSNLSTLHSWTSRHVWCMIPYIHEMGSLGLILDQNVNVNTNWNVHWKKSSGWRSLVIKHLYTCQVPFQSYPS